MKKSINLLWCLLLFTCTLFPFSGCSKDGNSNSVQNVIILIGDGMGANHIENAKTYFELSTQPFEQCYIGEVNTNSLSSGATDSAAAATALATGVSVKNRQVSHDGENEIKHIMEVASEKNMRTGIITNDTLTGATPAAFSAHAKDRGDVDSIIATQINSPLDLMIGKYDNTYYENEELFVSNGFSLCSSKEDLFATPSNQKVIANLDNIYSTYNPYYSEQIPLVDLVEFAINYLDNKNGFVLMIECGYIDKFSHNNEIVPALAEVRALIDIANYLKEYVDKNNNTALVITADHETGGLNKTTDKNLISNNLYTTDEHTDSKVPLYAKGLTFNTKKEIKNTHIFNNCLTLLNK